MANALLVMPMVIDTDIATFRGAAAVVAANVTQGQGIRILKLVLSVDPGGPSVAGTVTITAPSDSSTLYPPLVVPAASAANTILYVDNPEYGAKICWRDFAVTGLTATGTRLFIWYNV